MLISHFITGPELKLQKKYHLFLRLSDLAEALIIRTWTYFLSHSTDFQVALVELQTKYNRWTCLWQHVQYLRYSWKRCRFDVDQRISGTAAFVTLCCSSSGSRQVWLAIPPPPPAKWDWHPVDLARGRGGKYSLSHFVMKYFTLNIFNSKTHFLPYNCSFSWTAHPTVVGLARTAEAWLSAVW